MAPTPPHQRPAQGKGLDKKVGGIAVKWWAVGLVVAIGVGLYLRNKSASATNPASTSSTGTDTTGTGTGTVSGTSGGTVDLSPIEDLATALNGQSTAFGAGFTQLDTDINALAAQIAAGQTTPTTPTTPSTTTTTTTGTTTTTNPVITKKGATGAASLTPAEQKAVAIATSPNIKISAVEPQKAAPADVNAANVLSVVKLKSGAILTTLVGGRQVEQAPGKTPFVVNKGQGAPAGTTKKKKK